MLIRRTAKGRTYQVKNLDDISEKTDTTLVAPVIVAERNHRFNERAIIELVPSHGLSLEEAEN